MSDRYRIAIIDDTVMQRIMLKSLLAGKYDVTDYPSGGDFLADAQGFDAILLDIEMPGMNGYETCRSMRTLDQHEDTAVIFVSSHNSPRDRIEAYEAGGDHFLTKPVSADELNYKIESVIAHRNALRDLKSQTSWAQKAAFSAMASMGGLGVILEFFRKAARINDYQSLAELVVESLNAWELRGGVQIRGVSGEINTSTDAVISPLQTSVMATLRDMGRIFEFKSRAVVNFEHVSILIYNMPIDDSDKVGRIRDNLAWLGEGADTCIANMDGTNVSQQKISYLGDSIAGLRDLMQKAAVRDLTNRNSVQKKVTDVLDGLVLCFCNLGLTNMQKEYVTSMVSEGVDELTAAFEEAATIQGDFSEILFRLQDLADSEQARHGSAT